MPSKLTDIFSNVKIPTVRCRPVTRAAFAIAAIVGVAAMAGPAQALTFLPTFESSFSGKLSGVHLELRSTTAFLIFSARVAWAWHVAPRRLAEAIGLPQ
jgi:hypothetical protein